MSRFILLFHLLVGIMTFYAAADFVEVKTEYGKEYYRIQKRPKLNVCYKKRVKYHADDDRVYLRYDGCGLYRDSCNYNGLAHFGHYPSTRAAKNALYRCRTANPRFVD